MSMRTTHEKVQKCLEQQKYVTKLKWQWAEHGARQWRGKMLKLTAWRTRENYIYIAYKTPRKINGGGLCPGVEG